MGASWELLYRIGLNFAFVPLLHTRVNFMLINLLCFVDEGGSKETQETQGLYTLGYLVIFSVLIVLFIYSPESI